MTGPKKPVTKVEETEGGFLVSCSCGWSEFRTSMEKAELSSDGHEASGCSEASDEA